MQNTPGEPELWAPVRGSNGLVVSNYGRVYNELHGREIKFSMTGDGHPKISFDKYQIPTSRTVRQLVAEGHVNGMNHINDTVMLLDNNRRNLHAANLVWRPKWFVMRYVDQFNEPVFPFETGRVDEFDRYDFNIASYKSIWEAATTTGLLALDIQYSTINGKPVFPNWHRFAMR